MRNGKDRELIINLWRFSMQPLQKAYFSEVDFGNTEYTWNNGRKGPFEVRTRLDRWLVNDK